MTPPTSRRLKDVLIDIEKWEGQLREYYQGGGFTILDGTFYLLRGGACVLFHVTIRVIFSPSTLRAAQHSHAVGAHARARARARTHTPFQRISVGPASTQTWHVFLANISHSNQHASTSRRLHTPSDKRTG